MSRCFLISATTALCGLLAGCAQPVGSPLTIAAAASLAPIFDRLAPEFERQTGLVVTYAYGSTANLEEQIRNGAPFDAFAAADAPHVDRLIAEGLLDGGTRTTFAHGQLALANGSGLTLDGVEGLLDPRFDRLALANPAFAPYGMAARQALERSGLWEALQPRLIYAENVRDAGQLVVSGNAAAGLLAASTAISLDLRWVAVEDALFDPIEHVAAARVGGASHPAAKTFLAFLHGPQAAAVFERFGLQPVDE